MSLTPTHTFLMLFAFIYLFFLKARGICVHVPCHLGYTCQDLKVSVCVCVWMVNQSQATRLLSLTWLKITFLYILKFSKIMLFAIMFSSFWERFLKVLNIYCFWFTFRTVMLKFVLTVRLYWVSHTVYWPPVRSYTYLAECKTILKSCSSYQILL